MIILSVTGLIVNANNTPKLEIAQNSTLTKQRNPLNLVVPELVTIRLKKESYTGKLTAFNANNLTIEGNGKSQKFLISKIQKIEFKGDVWINNTDGTIRRVPWRGSSKILQELPITALKLEKNLKKATLHLDNMTEEGYNRFIKNASKNYGIKMIVFDSPEKITVKIKELN